MRYHARIYKLYGRPPKGYNYHCLWNYEDTRQNNWLLMTAQAHHFLHLEGHKDSKEVKTNKSIGSLGTNRNTTKAQRILIRILNQNGRTKVSLADEFNLCRPTIRKICRENS